MIELAIEAYALKDTVRTGWKLRGIREPESVSDHSWGTALLCMLYAGAECLDTERCLRIALVHDIAECRVGDIPKRVDPAAQPVSAAEKARLEQEAVDYLSALPGVENLEFARLWLEYEQRASAEALFVRDMNLIDMCLTALLYERGDRYESGGTSVNFPDFERLDEFFATAGPELSTPTARGLFADVSGRYDREKLRARGTGDPIS